MDRLEEIRRLIAAAAGANDNAGNAAAGFSLHIENLHIHLGDAGAGAERRRQRDELLRRLDELMGGEAALWATLLRRRWQVDAAAAMTDAQLRELVAALPDLLRQMRFARLAADGPGLGRFGPQADDGDGEDRS